MSLLIKACEEVGFRSFHILFSFFFFSYSFFLFADLRNTTFLSLLNKKIVSKNKISFPSTIIFFLPQKPLKVMFHKVVVCHD